MSYNVLAIKTSLCFASFVHLLSFRFFLNKEKKNSPKREILIGKHLTTHMRVSMILYGYLCTQLNMVSILLKKSKQERKKPIIIADYAVTFLLVLLNMK